MLFGKKLIALRKDHMMTQQDLASLLGVDKSTVSHYEAGNHIPDVEKMKIISDIFKVVIESMFDDNSPVVIKEKYSETFLDEIDSILDSITVTGDYRKDIDQSSIVQAEIDKLFNERKVLTDINNVDFNIEDMRWKNSIPLKKVIFDDRADKLIDRAISLHSELLKVIR